MLRPSVDPRWLPVPLAALLWRLRSGQLHESQVVERSPQDCDEISSTPRAADGQRSHPQRTATPKSPKAARHLDAPPSVHAERRRRTRQEARHGALGQPGAAAPIRSVGCVGRVRSATRGRGQPTEQRARRARQGSRAPPTGNGLSLSEPSSAASLCGFCGLCRVITQRPSAPRPSQYQRGQRRRQRWTRPPPRRRSQHGARTRRRPRHAPP